MKKRRYRSKRLLKRRRKVILKRLMSSILGLFSFMNTKKRKVTIGN